LFGKEHVDRYRETDGDEGYDWQGTTVLLLTSFRRPARADRVDADVTGQAEGGGTHESFDAAVGDGEAGGLPDLGPRHVAGHERE
jgi:hypothetical protein